MNNNKNKLKDNEKWTCREVVFLSRATLNDTWGYFSFPCDGRRQVIYSDSIEKKEFSLEIFNNGIFTFIVEVLEIIAEKKETKQYKIVGGSTVKITGGNIVDIYIYGTTNTNKRDATLLDSYNRGVSGAYEIERVYIDQN